MFSVAHGLWNPDFYYNKAPKPHSKLKKAQTTLREKQLGYKLLLGGESDNPTSKGIPQPPLWRRSVRGALCEARPRGWLAPFIFSKLFGLTEDPGPGAFRGLLAVASVASVASVAAVAAVAAVDR